MLLRALLTPLPLALGVLGLLAVSGVGAAHQHSARHQLFQLTVAAGVMHVTAVAIQYQARVETVVTAEMIVVAAVAEAAAAAAAVIRLLGALVQRVTQAVKMALAAVAVVEAVNLVQPAAGLASLAKALTVQAVRLIRMVKVVAVVAQVVPVVVYMVVVVPVQETIPLVAAALFVLFGPAQPVVSHQPALAIFNLEIT